MLFVNLIYFKNYENFHFFYYILMKIKIFRIDLYVYIINRKEVGEYIYIFIGEYIFLIILNI